jgi:transcriptional regulator with XRE-family HTH domain
MNRKDFGLLVSTLRQDLDWTQFQLAEYANVDEAVVSQIERGVKKYFEPELLFCLANTLQLTTLERREFFLASTGLEKKQLVRQPTMATNTDVFNVRKILDKMVNLTGQVRLPAFLVDAYNDVIAANNIILSFFQIPPTVLETASQIPGGYNTIRINFGKEAVMRNQIVNNWDSFALNSMLAFRESSLRYRAQPYFKYLMKAFRNPIEYPLFDRYWKMVSSLERDKEINLDYFSFSHERFEDVKYMASSTVTITSFGELFLVQHLPLDERTSRAFEQIAKETGQDVIRIAPWPVKNFLE